MICPNCKKEIDNDSKFCKFCGSNVNVQKTGQDDNNEKVRNLEKKMWFRIFKVAYVLLFVACTIFGIVFIFKNNYPTERYPNISESKIECLAGNRKEFSLQEGHVTPLLSKVDDSHFWWPSDKDRIRALCGFGYAENNSFHTHLVLEEEGGVEVAILYSLIFIAGLVLVFKLIKIIFFYIILGSKKSRR
jgi:hypothetical protein